MGASLHKLRKTISAQQSFDGLRVRDMERIPKQDVEQPGSKSGRLVAEIWR